jgi:uncharacterized protein YecE (DUF72 family)
MGIHIGTSGWSYDHWEGVLYPPGTPPSARRDLYVRHFDTVELNSSFYRWPRTAAFVRWREVLPDGFMFSVKAPRGLTHGRRLYSPEVWVDRMTQCWHELGNKRAALLLQLAPQHSRDDARLRYLLERLPRWMRVAVEFRHSSWHDDAVFALLEELGVAYCIMSGARLPCMLRATAPFVYVRMHGPDHDHLYAGSYSDADLGWWSDRLREWAASGKEVFVYFNNDGAGHAVRNAERLRDLSGSG